MILHWPTFAFLEKNYNNNNNLKYKVYCKIYMDLSCEGGKVSSGISHWGLYLLAV